MTPTASSVDYGILRQDRTTRDGVPAGLWTVSVKRQGEDVQRHFFDQVWGGREAALQMARAYRDAVLRLIPPVTKREAQTRLRRNNTSGVPGVFPKRAKGQIAGWIATLDTPHKRYAKTFMLSTHGDRAKELAIAERQRMLQEHGDNTFITVNAQATEEATRHFPELLTDDSPASPADIAAARTQRLRELNQWFDQQHPDQLYVRVRVYPSRPASETLMAHVRLVTTGSSSHVAVTGLSLGTQSYAQRQPELWQFIQNKVTAWLGEDRWQRFATQQKTSFAASGADTGWQARDYSAPPDAAKRRQVPAALLPLLQDFALPVLHKPPLPVLVEPPAVAAWPHTPSVSQTPPPRPAIISSERQARIRTTPSPAHLATRVKEEAPMDRTFKAHSPLGDQLRFRSLSGREQISRLFEFRVSLLSESDSISAKSLLGQDLSVEVDLTTEKNGGGKRFLSGQVVQFSFAGRDGDYFAYDAVLRPWLWLATRRSDFKIFQFKDVPAIVQEVLAPYGFTVVNKLTGSYRQWDYCVQYGESDFNFISRLLEAEGAYFYFEHAQGSHKLVLGDGIGSHSPLPQGPSTHPYYSGDRAAHVHDEDFIDGWRALEDIASGHFAADDYDFTKPKALLDTKQQQPAGHPQDSREIYDWPGGYTEVGDGENYARVRVEQLKAERELMHGAGNARNLAPGYLFNLTKYPRSDQNQQYLIEAADYRFEENVYRSDGGGGSGAAGRGGIDSPTTYRLSVQAVPSKLPYRSQRITPKPRTTGPQTAVVVGPPGEEIYTDEYGRVKVQFHWDRYGKMDENSSCWIRVSSPWAGSNYGGIHIPRIGQEVIVDFLNGDPDYPMITGRVYNAMQMPPWDLPANKTQSGFLTRSTKGGTPGHGLHNSPGTANAIRFEDMAGKEQLWLHAQKDQLTEVENDEDKWVGQDRRKTIDRDEFNTIHRDRTEIVDRNEKINVHGWRTEEVDLDETLTVHQNRHRRVDLDETVDIGVDRDKTIGKTETDTIGMNWKVNVGMFKMQNIGMGYMQNVGLVKIMSIGISYMENIGVLMQTNVGMNQNLVVGKDRDVKVGANQKTSVGDTRETNVKKDDKLVVGEEFFVHAKKIHMEADKEIVLTCGSSTIKITGSQIEILSPLDKLNC